MLSRAAVALGVTAFATAVAFQQAARDIVLRPANSILAEPFTRIHSIRELADGRVLVSENSNNNPESRLVVADLRFGRVRMIGNIGAGPGEYRQSGKLFALAAETTLFEDAAAGRRLLLLNGDSIFATLPPDLPAMNALGGALDGADSAGRLIGVRQMGTDQLSRDIGRQRLAAILAELRGTRADTNIRLRGPDQRVTQYGTKERPLWTIQILNGSVGDQVMLYRDGWIAIARQEPYVVEWRRPDRTLVRGPDVRWEAPRSDARERQAALERLRRRLGRTDVKDNLPWAERLAPFRHNALLGTPEGNLLVLRSQWSQATNTRYDLFDRTGQRIGQLAMPDSERVVGFGPRTVYIAVTDADGFQRLRRHPWP